MQISIDLDKLFPADLNLLSVVFFILTFGAVILLLSLVVRFILGPHSGLNQAISSAMGILSIYAIRCVVYTFDPAGLSQYLAPVPFATFVQDKMVLFSFATNDFPTICYQILSMVILAFLANLIDDLFPKGERILGWFIYRLFSILAAMALHYWVQLLIAAFIPGILEGYAPTILVCILLFMFSLGFLKLIAGLILTVVNPILGALYAFFFSHKIGKQLGKAVITTLILTVFVAVLENLDYLVIPISAAALDSYVPLAICLVILWFLVGRLL